MLWCVCVMYKNTSVINIRHCDNATKSSLFFCFRKARWEYTDFVFATLGAVSNSIAARNPSQNRPGYHIVVWKCTILFLLIAMVMNDYQGLLTYYRKCTMNFKLACQKVYVTWITLSPGPPVPPLSPAGPWKWKQHYICNGSKQRAQAIRNYME